MTKDTRKLQSALIEVGHEVEDMKNTPDLSDLEATLKALKFAEQLNDMVGMRRYSRQLAARVVKWMVEKL